MVRTLCAALLAATPLLLQACARPPAKASLLLITIDTLRADHLGCYGYERPTSPHIDRLAASGVLFERVFTSLPRTTQSIASLLTGRFPKSHGARGLFSALPEPNVTLAEILGARGYATAAVVSNLFLRSGLGFEQGFDAYDNPERRWVGDSASEITAAALSWLDARPADRPFFLWVHYLDPHWTYEPSPPFDTMFGPGEKIPFTVYDDIEAKRLTKGQIIFEKRLEPTQVARAIALYDGEITQVDDALGPLLERVRDILGPVLVVLTSDHGESLGEHDYYFAHGEYLYQPGLHIPLIISYPGELPAGMRAETLAQNVDVAPTILTLLGVDGMQSVDGRPILVRDRAPDGADPFRPAPGRPVVFAESDYQLIHRENRRYHIRGPRGRWSAASDGRFKLIQIPMASGNQLEFYDLVQDPGEMSNLHARARGNRPARDHLMRALAMFIDYQPGFGPADPRAIRPEERDRLRSLGYIN